MNVQDAVWVDARSIAAYEEVGDVVVGDATYVTNRFDLPFINFVGVNHHGQSVLLGCALVSHENTNTYKWVFRTLLKCMKGKAPPCILTYQAGAMRKALSVVMPSTQHWWCLWHNMQNLPKRLGSYKTYKDFISDLKDMIYDNLCGEEFERRWTALVLKYELGLNAWLIYMYEHRRMWVPAYHNDNFWAGKCYFTDYSLLLYTY